jgi:hypothetical protein
LKQKKAKEENEREYREELRREEEALQKEEEEKQKRETALVEHATKVFEEIKARVEPFGRYSVNAPHVDDITEMCRREGCDKVTAESALKKLEEIYVPFSVRMASESRLRSEFTESLPEVKAYRQAEGWESIPIIYKKINRRKHK